MAHEVRCYDYVNQPYATVRDALRSDLAGILARATKSATRRADAVAARLHVEVGALELGADVVIDVARVVESPRGTAGNAPATTFELSWKAARSAAAFPSMNAELVVYSLAKDETQLELRGVYQPPLGALGSVIDSVAGHRIAEASVHRFVTDIAKLLELELGQLAAAKADHG